MKAIFPSDIDTVTMSPSVANTLQDTTNFDSAFDKLGFKNYRLNQGLLVTKERQEEALLNIFYMADYFEPTKLWQDINHIPQIKNKKQVFLALTEALKQAGASQSEHNKFEAAILRQSLSAAHISMEWLDFLLYVSQNAFNRTLGQERDELVTQNWMENNASRYLQEAKMLGLVDRKAPALMEYDEAWIAGASRVGVLARLIDYNYMIALGTKVNGDELILAGQRELWANTDGLNPEAKQALETKEIINIDDLDVSALAGRCEKTIEEGKNYMLELAKKNGIKFNEQVPFIEYQKGETSIPLGRFPERVYINYEKGEKSKLTESMMSADLLNTYVKHDIGIIDTNSREGGIRPDTFGTAVDAANNFIDKIKSGQFGDKKHFVILYESNNPYIERQALATQRAVNKVLREADLNKNEYTIQIEGVGFSFKQDVVTIHSELAALLCEKWKFAHPEMSDIEAMKYLKPLLFQTRDNTYREEPLPKHSLLGVSDETGICQEFDL